MDHPMKTKFGIHLHGSCKYVQALLRRDAGSLTLFDKRIHSNALDPFHEQHSHRSYYIRPRQRNVESPRAVIFGDKHAIDFRLLQILICGCFTTIVHVSAPGDVDGSARVCEGIVEGIIDLCHINLALIVIKAATDNLRPTPILTG